MYMALTADAHVSKRAMKFRVGTRRLTLCSREGQHFSPLQRAYEERSPQSPLLEVLVN